MWFHFQPQRYNTYDTYDRIPYTRAQCRRYSFDTYDTDVWVLVHNTVHMMQNTYATYDMVQPKPYPNSMYRTNAAVPWYSSTAVQQCLFLVLRRSSSNCCQREMRWATTRVRYWFSIKAPSLPNEGAGNIKLQQYTVHLWACPQQSASQCVVCAPSTDCRTQRLQ